MTTEPDLRLSSLAALVLAGGKSQRMGRSKAHLLIDGEPLLTRTVRVLQSALARVVVIAQSGQDLPDLVGAPRLFDPVPGEGPLVGLLTGLAALEKKVEWVFVTATDAPLLHLSMVARLCDFTGDHQAVVPVVGGKRHVLTALYRTSLASFALELVNAGERRVSLLAERSDTRWVSEAELLADPAVALHDRELRSFINVNTEAELEALGASAAAGQTKR